MKNISIIIPTYNPDKRLLSVIDDLCEAGFEDIIIVNDGSESGRDGIFAEAVRNPRCTLLSHTVNMGKGRALKTAFNFILENRPDLVGAVTADDDGQHTLDDILAVAQAVTEETDKLILGVRDFDAPQVPRRNRFGNKTTRFVMRAATGLRITDTQTGLRGYPAALIPRFINLAGERFEYETNMLIELKRSGIPFREVGISVVYIDGNKTSKFRVFSDSLKIYKLFGFALTSLLAAAIDLGVFTLINLLLPEEAVGMAIKVLLATVAARIVSSVVNYTLNRRTVFEGSAKGSLKRYYTLWLFQLGASYGLVYLLITLTGAFGLWKTLLKLCIDILLFLVGYNIQKRWVFKKPASASGSDKKHI